MESLIQEKQSTKNNFITSEKIHNIVSLFFFIISIIFYQFIFVFSIVSQFIVVSIFSLLFIISFFLKIILQFHVVFSFSKLLKSIEEEKANFYIAKSWNRKKDSTVWIGTIFCMIPSLFLIGSLIFMNHLSQEEVLFTTIFLTLNIVVISVLQVINYTMVSKALTKVEHKFDSKSIEWTQIQNDHSSFYKLMFVMFISTILVIPLILLAIPYYRIKANEFIKK